MLEWFKSREADPTTTPEAPPNVPGRTGQAVEAMLGDAVLKLLLVMHRREHNPSSFPVDPGALNEWVVRRSTNTFTSTNGTTSSRVAVSSPRVCRRPRDTPTRTRRRSRRGLRGATATREAIFAPRERRCFQHSASNPRRSPSPGEDGESEDSGGAEGAKRPKVLKVPEGLKVPIR